MRDLACDRSRTRRLTVCGAPRFPAQLKRVRTDMEHEKQREKQRKQQQAELLHQVLEENQAQRQRRERAAEEERARDQAMLREHEARLAAVRAGTAELALRKLLTRAARGRASQEERRRQEELARRKHAIEQKMQVRGRRPWARPPR